jgi:hypothetical protein
MFLGTYKIVAWPICIFFMLGLVFAGSGQVLCIGDNGHIEIETYCLPSCGEAEKSCEIDLPEEPHNEHSECSNCSDIELNDPLWSSRIQNDNLYDYVNFPPAHFTDGHLGLISAYKNNSQVTKFHLAFGQSPPTYFITITVLHC